MKIKEYSEKWGDLIDTPKDMMAKYGLTISISFGLIWGVSSIIILIISSTTYEV